MTTKNDKVCPAHYAQLNPQPIKVIEDWRLDFISGNIIKYVVRAGNKPGESAIDDLEKARYYLNMAIRRARSQAGVKP
jgi:hypothetical protein